MEAERKRLQKANAKNDTFVRKQIEEETGMSAELDRAFELAFEAGRDQKPAAQGRLEMGGGSKKRARPETEDASRTSVYVRNLPPEVTWNKVEQHFGRCGDVRRVKLYKDAVGKPKGDALVIFKRESSAARAVRELHGMDIFGHVLEVSAADFTEKDNAEMTDADRVAKAVNTGEKDWNILRSVILLNMCTVEDIAAAPDPAAFITALEEDIWRGCAELGTLERVRLLPSDPECCVVVRYVAAKDAARCVERMNGRFFNFRQIHAVHWDGNVRRKLPDGADTDRQAKLGGGPPGNPAPEHRRESWEPAPAQEGAGPHAAPDPSPAEMMRREELEAMSVKELRTLVQSKGLSAHGCVEKADLVDRLMAG